MPDQDSIQRLIAEHVLWCREERDRLTSELALYKSVALSIGRTKVVEAFAHGGTTRISELQRTIEELDRVIECCSAPGSQSGVSPSCPEVHAVG